LGKKQSTKSSSSERGERLYNEVLNSYQHLGDLDEKRAAEVIESIDDALSEFGTTNQNKKAELKRIRRDVEAVLPPATVEDLKKRAQAYLLAKGFPRRQWLQRLLLIAVGLAVLSSLIIPIAVWLFRSKDVPRPGPSDEPITVKHVAFDPPSPIELSQDSVEIKATVQDDANKPVDVPVLWALKRDSDSIYVQIAQTGNTVKVTRKPRASEDTSDDLPLIIQLVIRAKLSAQTDAALIDGVSLIIKNSDHSGARFLSDRNEQFAYRSTQERQTRPTIITAVGSALPPTMRWVSSRQAQPSYELYPATSPVTSEAPAPVVFLMDTRVSEDVVYNPHTWRTGGTNANDIAAILGDIPIDPRIEPVNLVWFQSSRKQVIVNAGPRLIIIHHSCFYGHTNPVDDENRFQEFVRYVASRNQTVKFLVYSRSQGIVEREPSGQGRYLLPLRYERQLRIGGLRDRIMPFHIRRTPDSFCDPTTALDLKNLAANMLGLPYGSRPAQHARYPVDFGGAPRLAKSYAR